MRIIIFYLFCATAFASQGIYTSPTLGVTYGSSDEDALSSMLGINVGIVGGYRFGTSAFEFGIKRSAVSNSQIGDKDYDSEITNDMYFGGFRFFAGDIFSIAGGYTSHNLDFDVTGATIDSNGSYNSFYASMGINISQSADRDFFWEGNLYPISEADIFQVDFVAGFRFYL